MTLTTVAHHAVVGKNVLAGFDVFRRCAHGFFPALSPDSDVMFDPLHGSGFDCAGLFYLARHKTQASYPHKRRRLCSGWHLD
jgi:hypothetical protein